MREDSRIGSDRFGLDWDGNGTKGTTTQQQTGWKARGASRQVCEGRGGGVGPTKKWVHHHAMKSLAQDVDGVFEGYSDGCLGFPE